MKIQVVSMLLLALVAAQLIPYGREHSNPPVVSEPQWDNPRTKELFFRLCADCHSNETKWPWYSYYAPVSWLVQSDVDEGREHFNVSMWNAQEKNKGNAAAKEVVEGEMPPLAYMIPRRKIKFTEAERKVFLAGLVATFGSKVD